MIYSQAPDTTGPNWINADGNVDGVKQQEGVGIVAQNVPANANPNGKHVDKLR